MDDKLKNDIYEELKKAAKSGKDIITYKDLSDIVGLGPINQNITQILGEILTDISSNENEKGHPLLSVVAISYTNGIPGQGFFEL